MAEHQDSQQANTVTSSHLDPCRQQFRGTVRKNMTSLIISQSKFRTLNFLKPPQNILYYGKKTIVNLVFLPLKNCLSW